MKIAHINCFSLNEKFPCSLPAKIAGEANAARALGLDIDFIVLNNKINKEECNLKFIKSKTPLGELHMGGCVSYTFKSIDRGINLSSYDRIILRYPAPLAIDFYSGYFLRKYGDKIITEHHTDEISELKSRFPRKFSSHIRLMIERISASMLLSSVKGIIAVTNEIREIELQKAAMKKPSITISNGVDVENIQFTKFKPFDGKILNIIFISSVFFEWQGLDRLLEGIKRYKGNVKINLFLIGAPYNQRCMDEIKAIRQSNVNIQILDNKYGVELDRFFSNSTVAVSTLGLFKKNMTQACPLKTREYMARGIPFIYAYDEPDIEDRCDFALKFQNNNNFIEMEKIIEFAKRTAGIPEISQKMKEHASHHLDWKIKIKKMYEFARDI